MKKLYATLAVLVAAAFIAGSATGASSGDTGIQWSHVNNGVWCKTGSGGVMCVPTSGRGYGVGIHRNFVMVMQFPSNRIVFKRLQNQ